MVSDLGDAGELLDARAARDYERRADHLGRRLAGLREQLEEAAARNDLGWQGELCDEIERVLGEREFLARQLAAAGRGGGSGRCGREGRRAASHRERARQIVNKNIKAALLKIEKSLPNLAHHLRTHVKTGAMCVYRPDLERPIRWVLAADE
jgi:hypothetical protein